MLAVNLWVSGKQVAHGVLGAMGAGISPFPYALIYPQDEHERLLIDRLAEAGRAGRAQNGVRWPRGKAGSCARASATSGWRRSGVRGELRCRLRRRAFHGARDAGDRFPGRHVRAPLLCRRRRSQRCDNQRRTSRRSGHGRFSRHIPVEGRRALAARRHRTGGARPIGTKTLSWNDVSRRVLAWMRIDVANVNWFSTYHVHHRVADHFRKGRDIPARRRRTHPQPRRRPGHEHRHRRRNQPRLEACRRSGRTRGRVAARQLRAGANRLCPAPGRDDRSSFHRA